MARWRVKERNTALRYDGRMEHDERPEAGDPPSAEPGGWRGARTRLFAAIALAVVVLDQTTKGLIRGWLDEGETWPAGAGLIRIAHVENSGAAFGVLQGAGVLLVAASLAGVAAVLLLLRAAPAGDRLHAAALALVLGGAVGNLIDRLLRGEVTDFIDPARYPAFNLADSAIVTGVAALVLLALFGGARSRAAG